MVISTFRDLKNLIKEDFSEEYAFIEVKNATTQVDVRDYHLNIYALIAGVLFVYRNGEFKPSTRKGLLRS